MSDSNPVTWRLNDLLEAGKKAKAFASSPMQKNVDSIDNKNFSLTSYELTNELDDTTNEPLEIHSNLEENVPDSSEEESEELESPEGPETFLPDSLTEEDYHRMIEESEVFKKRIEQAREDGVKEGLAKGMNEAKEEWESSVQSLKQFLKDLRAADGDKSRYFEPVKKLSVHLANHLVRGELSLSGIAIERLVHEALNLVEKNSKGVIVVWLNPEDKERYEEVALLDDQLELREDPELMAGSVRLSVEDSAIEDLIENRLSSLSDLVLNQSDGWRASGHKENPVGSSVEEEKGKEVLEGELITTLEAEGASTALEATQVADNTEPVDQLGLKAINEPEIQTDNQLDATSGVEEEGERS